MAFDKTIQMYIFDGDPNGRMMCELSNWNGRVYKIARSQLSQFARREDAESTGVYFLFGRDEENHDTVYIGEAEKVSVRLKQHLAEEYWNDCVVVISKDNLLNKAHIKYLENTFYTLAKEAGRFTILNSTIPTRSSISEYDSAMLEEFIYNTKLLVNVLGYKVFDAIPKLVPSTPKTPSEFVLQSNRGASARGIPVADGFAVLKGSVISEDTTSGLANSLLHKRNQLLSDQTIDQNRQFTKDCIFTSPSTAAAIVLGRSANGRTEWKTAEGRTLKEIEENNLE